MAAHRRHHHSSPWPTSPGDNIVLVVTAASHRGDAFAAAEFLMHYLKTRAPFWKKIEAPDGARWVDAKSTDDAAADRWTSGARAE